MIWLVGRGLQCLSPNVFKSVHLSALNMKKFIIEHVGKGTAVNAGFGFERTAVFNLGSDVAFKTPGLLLGSKCAAIPTITPETFEMGGLRSNPDLFAGLLVPMQDLVKSFDVLQGYQKGKTVS